jgi:hypothetical protein
LTYYTGKNPSLTTYSIGKTAGVGIKALAGDNEKQGNCSWAEMGSSLQNM